MKRLGFIILATALSVAPVAAGVGTPVFINELHYDNTGGDVGEFVEVAGPAGTDLTGWTIILYNGSGGAPYGTLALSGLIPDQFGGFGTVLVPGPGTGIQNGAPDGLALVDASSTVIQFLSYEGTFTAVGGPADGILSTDIGVAELGSDPVGHSLQLKDPSELAIFAYEDFVWSPPSPGSPGAPNVGQTLPVELSNFSID